MEFWTKQEFKQFLPSMDKKPEAKMAFMLLYWTGMRIGELLALGKRKTVVKPVKSRLTAVFCFAAICAIVLYFLDYGKFISFVCLMMLRIVDFLVNS